MKADTSLEACREILEQHHGALWKAAAWAVAEFNKIPDEQRLPLVQTKRALRTTIHTYWLEAIRIVESAGWSGVKVTWPHETAELFFGNNLVLRLKHVDDDGFSANYPTERARRWSVGNNYEMFSDVWAVPNRLELGYQLNALATEIERLQVIRALSADEIHWRYDILPPAAPAAVPLPVDLPVPGVGGKRRVMLRESEREPGTKENEAER